MSLERQIPDHILSPRLAHRTTDSAVGQPLIGATWVGKYPRVCHWHARTRRWADTWRQGTPWAWLTPPHTHTHTRIHTHTHTHTPPHAPHPLFLPSGNNTMFLILSQWSLSLSMSAEQPCSHRCCVCLCEWECVYLFRKLIQLFLLFKEIGTFNQVLHFNTNLRYLCYAIV